MLDEATIKFLTEAQRNEITEHFIYRRLSQSCRNSRNREVLKKISEDELRHCQTWRHYTHRDATPNRWQIWKYYLIARVFGLTFGVKLMERGEGRAKITYDSIVRVIPEAEKVVREEEAHERELIELIDEEKLRYIGSIVLGLNDALVELMGALAGFTLALRQPRLVALAGLITGIAASFSMAASEYLSTKAESVETERGEKHPLKASLYTGMTYLLTVFFLVTPYLVLDNPFFSLSITITFAIVIIFFFTFYLSVAKGIPFSRRFAEMISVSLGVALLSFGIGFVVRQLIPDA